MKPSQRKLYRTPVKKVVPPPPVPVVAVRPKPSSLHTFHDGSELKVLSAKELATIEIWHSQRTLDVKHKNYISHQVEHSIKSLDGSLYHIVRYPPDEDSEEIRRIIDGQHRAAVLKDYFENNPEAETFQVLIKEKFCETEDEAISYFKILNTTKAIEWKEDPKLVAQKYLEALFKIFKNDKTKFFRTNKTKRPFVHIEKLEQELVRRIWRISKMRPDEFAEEVFAWNERKVEDLLNLDGPRSSLQTQALEKAFTLGLDETFPWLDAF
jgi:hypothetical protein